MTKIFLTGSTGMVGWAVTARLKGQNSQYDMILADRQVLGDLACVDSTNLNINADIVIHCAARVHQVRETAQDSLAAYRAVNTQGTLELARAAARCGVKRFIFLSTIKVNGESTETGVPFHAHDNPAPQDPYAISKYEAEEGLKTIAKATGMEVVIIRPPLVYGAGVKANFLSLINWTRRGIPLPFGGIRNNRRSFVFVENLADLIITCVDHPAAAGQIFLVSDGEDISTADLIEKIAKAQNITPRLIPIPPKFLNAVLSLMGRRAMAARICGNLQVDITATQHRLNWHPPFTMAAGLEKTVSNF